MVPPTCTVLVMSVRTTAAVLSGLPAPDDEAALVALPLVDTLATPTATTPPTTAPAMAARATILLAENSAIGACPRAGAGVRARVGAAGEAGPVEHDCSRGRVADTGQVDVVLGGAQLRGVLERGAARVQVAAGVHAERQRVVRGIGKIRDSVGAHALGVLLQGGLGWWVRGLAPLQCGLGSVQVRGAGN